MRAKIAGSSTIALPAKVRGLSLDFLSAFAVPFFALSALTALSVAGAAPPALARATICSACSVVTELEWAFTSNPKACAVATSSAFDNPVSLAIWLILFFSDNLCPPYIISSS